MIRIRILVENRAEELMVDALFADCIQAGAVGVTMCWDASSAVSIAESSLLRSPQLAVALVLNEATEPTDFRQSIERLLSSAAPRTSWQVTLAAPDLAAWLKLDPAFSAALAAAGPSVAASKADFAAWAKSWSRTQPNRFNRQAIASQNAEFDRLNRFVEQFATVSEVA